MTPLLFAALATGLAALLPALHWDPGTSDRHPQPHAAIEVRSLDASTYVLRESLQDTWEAPLIYLLIGRDRALLLDTGDVADPVAMPLAKTVQGLLPSTGGGALPLIVLHTHGHLDHRAGDGQFAGLAGVELVPATAPALTARFGFTRWPDGAATLDLGERIVDVLPAPGHHPAELVLYDRNSELVFSGDFLLPGRLLVDDRAAYAASARRVADFVRDKPVRGVLGAHIEKTANGELYDWQAPSHPDEASLALAKADLLALPDALDGFNGFYSQTGNLVLMNTVHILMAAAGAVLAVLVVLTWLVVRGIRRWRRRRRATV